MKNTWTKTEVDLLKKYFSMMNVNKLIEIIDKSYSCIKAKAKRINLKSYYFLKHIWSAEEINYLKENYSKMYPEELQLKLEKSLSGIHHKANKLGLISVKSFNGLSEKQKREMSEKRKGIARRPKGFKLSKITKRKLSKKAKLRRASDETKIKLSLRQKGEKNCRWKGGISKNYRNKIAEREWEKLSKETYERDKYICQGCGTNRYKKHGIQAHHIIPFILTQDDNITNLETLCRSCHSKKEYQFQYLL